MREVAVHTDGGIIAGSDLVLTDKNIARQDQRPLAWPGTGWAGLQSNQPAGRNRRLRLNPY